MLTLHRPLLALLIVAMSVPAALALDNDGRSAQQFNAWTSAQVQVQLSSRWWLVPEVQWRRSAGFAEALQEGLLIAPEYRQGRWSAQPGYAHWNTHPYGEFRTPATQREHRTWLQFGFQHPLGNFRMDHRLRTEQRFLERHSVHPEGPASQGYKYVGRLRYRTRLMTILNDKRGEAGEWQAILQKEWMFRYGDEAFRGTFDQVRPAVHLGFRPVRDLQFTAGYQMQYLLRSNGMDEEFNHTLMVGAFWKLPRPERPRPEQL